MSEANENNSASTSQPEIGDDEVVQLRDVIKQQDDMMEEVAAVLGAGDDFNCSYNQGYMTRQALYACLTCVPQGKDDFTKAAGFCLACSYHCHDGHNLIELYTKRQFRCDCGNLKFGDVQCNLHTNKDDYNNENIYNQNFSGVYCICHKPYPDPDDHIEDDMIQCIICEDWYHSRHLNTAAVEDFAEMICETCVKDHSFLMSYVGMALTKVEPAKVDEQVNVTTDQETTEMKKDETVVNSTDIPKIVDQVDDKTKEETAKEDKEVMEQELTEVKEKTIEETTNEKEVSIETCSEEVTVKEITIEEIVETMEEKEEEVSMETFSEDATVTEITIEEKEETAKENEVSMETSSEEVEEKSTEDKSKENGDQEPTVNTEISKTTEKEMSENQDNKCIKPKLRDTPQPRTLFMKELAWRQTLCKCESCLNLYKEGKLDYLLDPEDTVQFYEAKGKEQYQHAKKEALEAEQQILKNMPRAPMLNALAGFNDFKEQLAEYLKEFAEQKKVLTVDDVNVFFSKLNSNKRQKTSESTYFCR